MIWGRILLTFMSMVQAWGRWRERMADRRAGAEAERLKILEAENAMENQPVNPVSRDELLDRFRKGGF